MQFAPDPDFVKRLQNNTKRYQTLFAQQADIMLDPKTPGSIQPTQPVPVNTYDVLMQQVMHVYPVKHAPDAVTGATHLD